MEMLKSLENLNSDVGQPTHSKWLETGSSVNLPPEDEDGDGNEAFEEEQEEEGKKQGWKQTHLSPTLILCQFSRVWKFNRLVACSYL